MKKEIGLVADDGWLKPYEADIIQRYDFYRNRLEKIEKGHGSLESFASGDSYYGFNYDKKAKGWWYREWAPAADGLALIGDFNDWDVELHPLTQDEHGTWGVFVADHSEHPLMHESLLKVKVQNGFQDRDRLPAYIKRAVQDEKTYDFKGQIWAPKKKFKWSDKKFSPKTITNPVIYECHIGMAQEKEGVGTYVEFADEVLPRVAKLGYNCLQMMAIQEHPYYGSFGYHVSNFFAPTSRFGTPEDLKYLIDKAHGLGIAVIMDAVYSHAVKNIAEGLNDFDGSDNQYFHKGGRGYHTGWDSKLFDYSRTEVLQFLLSSVRYWIEEFHFDGFRFDGVTSMLYHHHGEGVAFDHYDKYFKDMVDWDAICFLQLANTLTHELKPGAINIAEDMSGMPGMCRSVEDGGIGFDYRLGMGIPDYWIKTLKHKADEEWDIYEMWDVLNNRRYKEKTIAYAESHDQALVGDKTLAFWLMDKEMYWHMSKGDANPVIDRGMALHKMLRLFTGALGGEGYLTFIGNEFGHPEWIDFPREGNGWSYKYARRQWSLVDNEQLKYQQLNDFDGAMIHLLKRYQVLSAQPAQQLNMDGTNQVIVFERNNLIFVFNFSTSSSVADYRFFINQPGTFQIVLDSDDAAFGGHARCDASVFHTTVEVEGRPQLSLYTPCRSVQVYAKSDQ
ncbi:alpha amylase C-terminal domain-containing protein [Reichenbachiella agariperforans]|uniref:alpha amylase C-terminal domain-containing protein n=1 Tax=Reichenbachiella agariperforans TaxID=156994 RepID=UPI001C08B999|nr:alpha amylase C-terminal domain-containing protein [Reichenbachiella agariperforans]MBU2914463.1 alpha amylase C-terminal domain-containing protein [Reichenbachiella agariperforans]